VKDLPGKPVDPRIWSNTLPTYEKVKEWGALKNQASNSPAKEA
jgi:hypothetical protein